MVPELAQAGAAPAPAKGSDADPKATSSLAGTDASAESPIP